MKVRSLKTWANFKSQVVQKYVGLPAEDRRLFWFRGQPSASWRLVTTLDRFAPDLPDDDQRAILADELLNEFREQTIGLGITNVPPQGRALELLARHHGLPSAILDWTESPYIASFFAFQERTTADLAEPVAIWAFTDRCAMNVKFSSF